MSEEQNVHNVYNVQNQGTESVNDEARRRKVYVSPKALVELIGPDGDVKGSWEVGRNVHSMIEFLRTHFDGEQVVGIYLVEDEEASDPPAEGEDRMRSPLVPPTTDKDGNVENHERMKVKDAVSSLVSAITPDVDVVRQFRMDCDMATVRSGMDCAILTFVFAGRPAGFIFLNACKDVPVSSLGTLYEAAKSQVDRMRREFRELAPGIRFSDDPDPTAENPGIVLPTGAPAPTSGQVGIVTPDKAEEEMEKAGMARVVSIV